MLTLTGIDLQILIALNLAGPMHEDLIQTKTGFGLPAVYTSLRILELDRSVGRELFGNAGPLWHITSNGEQRLLERTHAGRVAATA